MTDREILLNLIAGLSLCDHMGDASSDAFHALKLLGIDVPDGVDDGDDDSLTLGQWLAETHGATTLYGTSLRREDEK